MAQFFRETFRPLKKYFSSGDYREYLRVKSACRNKPAGTPVTIRAGGYSVRSNNASSLLHLYEEIFVRRAFEANFDRRDPVILCCGANVGLEIFFFKKQFPAARIRAYEADPQIAKILQENISSNKLSNVEAVGAAVWTENGTVPFRSDGALGGKTGDGGPGVPAIRLADELAKEPVTDLLIIDIEGAETAVLNDCKKELQRVKRLFVEWHGGEHSPQQLQQLLQLLSETGFRYRLGNLLPPAPFANKIVENGFDAMVEIYAER